MDSERLRALLDAVAGGRMTAEDAMARLWEDDRHERIVARFRELGYVYVAVDLAGFQSGSANLLLRLRSNG